MLDHVAWRLFLQTSLINDQLDLSVMFKQLHQLLCKINNCKMSIIRK